MCLNNNTPKKRKAIINEIRIDKIIVFLVFSYYHYNKTSFREIHEKLFNNNNN
jgi:hypothetical protein